MFSVNVGCWQTMIWGQLPVFMNKVLLAHSQSHSFMFGQWLFFVLFCFVLLQWHSWVAMTDTAQLVKAEIFISSPLQNFSPDHLTSVLVCPYPCFVSLQAKIYHWLRTQMRHHSLNFQLRYPRTISGAFRHTLPQPLHLRTFSWVQQYSFHPSMHPEHQLSARDQARSWECKDD